MGSSYKKARTANAMGERRTGGLATICEPIVVLRLVILILLELECVKRRIAEDG